jgi:hypothetical protein
LIRGQESRAESREPEIAGSRLQLALIDKEFVMVCTNTTLPARPVASSIVLLARILDAAGRPVFATDVVGIECTIRDVDSYMPGTGIDANPFEVILPSLVRDESWTVDDIGYNFRHDLTHVADFASLALPEFSGRAEVRYDFMLVDCTWATVRFYLKLV